MNGAVAALALQLVPEIGPATAKRLIDWFGGPEAVFGASEEELLSVEGLGRKRAGQIRSFDGWKAAEHAADDCVRKDIRIAHYGEAPYPELLGQITDPPTVLYYRGTLAPEDRFAVSIVGPRVSGPYGKGVAQFLSEGLAAMGFTIVSGMARGIDTIAHLAALQKGARTVAVLGSGVDVIYPPECRGVHTRIPEHGAVMSEFPPGTPPNRENFPQRNRIISGLALGVIVVEAAKGSGTLITAAAALDQGREVFAVPGNITSALSHGTNDLLKRGARVVTGPDDVVRELGPVLRGFIRGERSRAPELTEEEREICDILSPEPVHIDEITRRSRRSPSRILGLLLGLELKSVVRQTEGKKFCLMLEEHGV